MKLYKPRPVRNVVEAVLYDGTNQDEALEFCAGFITSSGLLGFGTDAGIHYVKPGRYIVKGNGGLTVKDASEFEAQYEPLLQV